MTKNTLLLATAAAALLSAGTGAVASEISGTGTFAGVNKTTTSTPLRLANELRFATTVSSTAPAATRGALTYDFLPSNAGGFPVGESLLLTINVTGGLFSSDAASATVVSNTGSCSASVSPASPVAQGSATATYFVNFGSGCNNSASGLSISLPVQVTAANDVTVTTGLQSSFGGALFAVDGGPSTATFVRSVDAFTTTITPGTTTAVAEVSGGYTAFSSGASTSTVTFAVDSTASVAVNTFTAASFSDIAEARIIAAPVTGSFTGFNLTSNDTRFSATGTASTSRTIEVDPSSTTATFTINVVDNTATATGSGVTAADLNGVIAATSITLTVDTDLLADNNFGTSTGTYVDYSTASAAFAVTSRNGASFVAPWVALNNAGTSASIRLANNGSTPTGPITVTLLSTINGSTPTTASVTVTQAELQGGTLAGNGGIAPGSAVSIAGSLLAAKFGTTAGNGDVSVAVEAQASQISAKVRATTTSGEIFEQSLGNLSTAN